MPAHSMVYRFSKIPRQQYVFAFFIFVVQFDVGKDIRFAILKKRLHHDVHINESMKVTKTNLTNKVVLGSVTSKKQRKGLRIV